MIKVIIIGAAGQMGRRLVNCVVNAEDMELAGALERPDCPDIGKDAAAVAGLESSGVEIGSDLKAFLDSADAVIDFSTGPVVENAKLAVSADCTVVIGTTALNDSDRNSLKELAGQGGRIVFAPNMSVGVNLLFDLSSKVSKTLGDDYDVEIVETHHRRKKDAPSGTAVRLAEIISEAKGLSYSENTVYGRKGNVGARPKNEIGIHAVRAGDVVGEHSVIFASEGERLELVHKASSRDTFAKGALRALRFLENAEPGLYDMQDVINSG